MRCKILGLIIPRAPIPFFTPGIPIQGRRYECARHARRRTREEPLRAASSGKAARSATHSSSLAMSGIPQEPKPAS
ncbi:hypothetical protein CLOP_g9989 [Closterium sp. NIES-67]|nr:hypothetical protein CLOP_g9989 [Closterium sp. NIES-67]